MSQNLTPKMARLSLSSVALRDSIVHGLSITKPDYAGTEYLQLHPQQFAFWFQNPALASRQHEGPGGNDA